MPTCPATVGANTARRCSTRSPPRACASLTAMPTARSARQCGLASSPDDTSTAPELASRNRWAVPAAARWGSTRHTRRCPPCCGTRAIIPRSSASGTWACCPVSAHCRAATTSSGAIAAVASTTSRTTVAAATICGTATCRSRGWAITPTCWPSAAWNSSLSAPAKPGPGCSRCTSPRRIGPWRPTTRRGGPNPRVSPPSSSSRPPPPCSTMTAAPRRPMPPWSPRSTPRSAASWPGLARWAWPAIPWSCSPATMAASGSPTPGRSAAARPNCSKAASACR